MQVALLGQNSATPLPSQEKKHLERYGGLSPEGQGQNTTLSVLYVPYSLDSALARGGTRVPPLAR